MRIILLIVSFIIIIFTLIIFYIGIYDEVYQELEKNKLWHSDGSFSKRLIFLLASIFCLKYIFKNCQKNKKLNLYEQYYSTKTFEMELIKHDKNYGKYKY